MRCETGKATTAKRILNISASLILTLSFSFSLSLSLSFSFFLSLSFFRSLSFSLSFSLFLSLSLSLSCFADHVPRDELWPIEREQSGHELHCPTASLIQRLSLSRLRTVHLRRERERERGGREERHEQGICTVRTTHTYSASILLFVSLSLYLSVSFLS